MRDEVTFDSDQLTLTWISTGGPATTVTWTRDSTTTVTEGTETVLDDPETAQYTHTLTVTTGGEYTCTVENNKPSSDSATITIPGGMVVQNGPTSIRVTYSLHMVESQKFKKNCGFCDHPWISICTAASIQVFPCVAEVMCVGGVLYTQCTSGGWDCCSE